MGWKNREWVAGMGGSRFGWRCRVIPCRSNHPGPGILPQLLLLAAKKSVHAVTTCKQDNSWIMGVNGQTNSRQIVRYSRCVSQCWLQTVWRQCRRGVCVARSSAYRRFVAARAASGGCAASRSQEAQSTAQNRELGDASKKIYIGHPRSDAEVASATTLITILLQK